MKQEYIINYKHPSGFMALHDWTDYDIEIITVWFWGLFRTKKIGKFRDYHKLPHYLDNLKARILRDRKILGLDK